MNSLSPTQAWLCVLIAGALEVIWAIGLKYAHGFTRPGPSLLVIVAALASFWLLSIAMRTLPAGTAYAVWVGIGAAGTAIFGMILMSESASLARLVCLALILAGVLGLKWLS